ncbi:hypothetical protein [Neorhizobium huautlense]|uniref:hypothetical protein n=1 Tax=Neorhizobium huautlense TaxID=67774 RepID=UPI001300AE7C|nr:hypothetical protein [Neorhizobium huautlense]
MVDQINDVERARIVSVLDAAKRGLWDDFKRLTDVDFPNEESMHSQFQASIEQLRQFNGLSSFESHAQPQSDGSRLIYVRIAPVESARTSIRMTLQSSPPGCDHGIRILTFHPEL